MRGERKKWYHIGYWPLLELEGEHHLHAHYYTGDSSSHRLHPSVVFARDPIQQQADIEQEVAKRPSPHLVGSTNV